MLSDRPSEVRDLFVLCAIPGIGPAKIKALLSKFEVPSAALAASRQQLLSTEGIDRVLADRIRDPNGRNGKLAENQAVLLRKYKARLSCVLDSDYPYLLNQIYDPPPFLFVHGDPGLLHQAAVAVVGTRRPTEYARTVTEKLCSDLAASGIIVISGLARGVDTVAHEATLRAGGKTVAVLGCGIDRVYPPENRDLQRRITDTGAVISEYFIGDKPEAGNFPRRNRIISGLSPGTVIVEAGSKSGALITGAFALDQNREVFAVPGEITNPWCSGTNAMIRDGRAKLVQTVEDILCEIPYQKGESPDEGQDAGPNPAVSSLTAAERELFDLLENKPMHIDKISRSLRRTTSDCLVQLLQLELAGLVRQLAGKMFVRTVS